MKKLASLYTLFFLLPFVAFAGTTGGVSGVLTTANDIITKLIPLLIGAAVVVFFWGLVQYILSSGEGHGTGRNVMIAGIVALFIMVSVWGIVHLAQSTLSITGSETVNAPQLPK